MAADPLCQAALVEATVGYPHYPQHGGDYLGLRRFDLEAVEKQEHVHGHEAHPFVAIYERVILGEAEAVRSREGG